MADLNALQQAFQAGRLAHALLVTGASEQSVHKTAFSLLQILFCETKSGCGRCAACLRVAQKNHESLMTILPESGTIKIDQVKPIRDNLSLNAWNGVRAIWMPEVDCLNPQAANAILKILEEPPPQSYFILTTTKMASVLSTIRSRCQLVRAGFYSENEDSFFGIGNEELLRRGSDWMDSLIGGQMVEDLNWREVVKDRDNALLLVKHWLVFLLAAKKQSVGAGDVVPRFWTASQVEIAAKFDFRLDFIWNQVMNLKTEIEMQVDRALAFESFFIWWIQNHSTRLRKENHEHLD